MPNSSASLPTSFDWRIFSQIFKKSLKMEKLQDIVGKRVGYIGHFGKVMVDDLARQAGIPATDYTMVRVGMNVTDAIIRGEIDTGWKQKKIGKVPLNDHLSESRVLDVRNWRDWGNQELDSRISRKSNSKSSQERWIKVLRTFKAEDLPYFPLHSPQGCCASTNWTVSAAAASAPSSSSRPIPFTTRTRPWSPPSCARCGGDVPRRIKGPRHLLVRLTRSNAMQGHGLHHWESGPGLGHHVPRQPSPQHRVRLLSLPEPHVPADSAVRRLYTKIFQRTAPYFSRNLLNVERDWSKVSPTPHPAPEFPAPSLQRRW
jgi:hypothetical protein